MASLKIFCDILTKEWKKTTFASFSLTPMANGHGNQWNSMGINGNQWKSMEINGPQTKPYQGGVHHTYKGESTLVNSPINLI